LAAGRGDDYAAAMNFSHADITARLELALEAGKEAGKLTVDYFRQRVAAERKSDDSPVTIADREAELHLRRRISTAFPNDGIVGEEFGELPGTSGVRWILDPIDGTKSFITGVPMYGTMIGVEINGRPEIGFVYIAALDEGIYAARGRGAWHFVGKAEPQRAQVSASKSLSEGAFVTSQVDTFDKRGAGEAFLKLQKAAYITRTWGDCYGYLLVATGRALVMVDPIMNVWDAAAIQPIMEEAGGTFTDWSGNATIYNGEGIGTNGHVLEEVLAITRNATGAA
jgi:histidinol phosphatase-like enzyme (inositol monophosphatase family)